MTLAAALLLAPILALVDAIPDWVPANDPAYMGIRSLEVGTSDTPLNGQPSTSGQYVEGFANVNHPGPLHFYLMALPMRLMGLSMGMLSVSLVIVSTCILLMAWLTYRRLGPLGGVLGAVIIGLVTFTTGASALTNPVSSNMAGYPLYCSAVLVWCLLRGDLRLLPLATAITAFAAQQHLSVLPTVAVLAPVGVAGLLYHWGRDGRWRDSQARRQLLRWVGPSVAIGLVLWSPMILQQFVGEQGNLSHLVYLAQASDRPTLGYGSAVRQIAHVLGLPPMLGQLNLTGASLIDSPSLLTWVSAAAVLVILAGLGWRWRRAAPERFSLVLMSGLLMVAGLVNGSAVLDGIERVRLVLYHWVFPLAFFVTLALALGVAEGVRNLSSRLASRRPEWTSKWSRPVRPALVGGAALVVAVPALVNPSLDRESNELAAFSASLERRYVEELVDQVMAHREEFDEPLLLVSRGWRGFASMRESLALYMTAEGVDVRHPLAVRHYVSDGRLIDEDHSTGALLLVHDTSPVWAEVDGGELIADVLTVENLDSEAFNTVLEDLRSTDEYRFSPSLREFFDDFPDEWVDAAERGELQSLLDATQAAGQDLSNPSQEQEDRFWALIGLDRLNRDPANNVTDAELLGLLLEHPLEEPELDPDVLRDLLSSDLGSLSTDRPFRLRVYLLDHEELLDLGGNYDVPATSPPATN